VEFYSKNKFEKLVYRVGFIERMYHDARSPEHQISQYRDCKMASLEVLDKVCFVCGKYCISIMAWFEGGILFIAVPCSRSAVRSAVRSQVLVTEEK